MFKPEHKFTESDVVTLSRELAYGSFLKVDRVKLKHRMFNGDWSPPILREVLVRERAVGVLLFDPKREEIVLVRQFRVGVMNDSQGAWILEIVAGMVSEKEQFSDVAIRETEEESGCKVLKLIEICEYYNSPGITNEKVILYCGLIDATNAGGVHGLKEEHEDIASIVLPYKDAIHRLKSGRVNNPMTIIALQWLMLNKSAIKKHEI
jgi:ADP-ribose pyrophosphatase